MVSQISLGFIQHGFRYPQHPSRHDPTLLHLAFKEFIKIVISLGLLWRQNIRKSSTSSHVADWERGSNVFPLHNSTRYSSDGLYSDTMIVDTASSHQSVLTDDNMDENNLRTIYHNDEPSDNQSEWPTPQHMFVLAGLYAVHQTIVSRHPSFTAAIIFIILQDGSLIRFADARTISIIRLLLIFFTTGQMKFILDSQIPSSYWTSAMLQVRLTLSINCVAHRDPHVIRWPLCSFKNFSPSSVTTAVRPTPC